MSAVEAKYLIENITQSNYNDPYSKAALASIREELKYENASEPALSVLFEEIFYGFYILSWTQSMETGPEILERMRTIAINELPSDSPFRAIKDISYKDPMIAIALKKVADILNASGQKLYAFNQMRNAVSSLTMYGFKSTKDWYIDIANQADLLEEDSLSAKLARYSAQIIELKP
jgi:hypothetical protein